MSIQQFGSRSSFSELYSHLWDHDHMKETFASRHGSNVRYIIHKVIRGPNTFIIKRKKVCLSFAIFGIFKCSIWFHQTFSSIRICTPPLLFIRILHDVGPF